MASHDRGANPLPDPRQRILQCGAIRGRRRRRLFELESRSQMTETAPSSSPSAPPRTTLFWIQAGWLLIAGGFLLALVCAVVLAQEIRGTEQLFSDLHRMSMYIMLAGLGSLAIGYRMLQRHRNQEHQAERLQKAQSSQNGSEVIVATLATPSNPPAQNPTAPTVESLETPSRHPSPSAPHPLGEVIVDHWIQIATDGEELVGTTWRPSDKPVGTLFVIHGLSDHIQRYDDVARFLVGRGYCVVGYDQRGHGRSSGIRGHAPSFGCLLRDVLEIWSDRMSLEAGPHFLYGHSLGGCEALNVALRPLHLSPAIDGVIASSPLLLPARPIPWWKELAARIANHIYPQLAFSTGIDPLELTHDYQVAERLRRDPYWHRSVTARLGLEMFAAGEWALAHAHELKIPTLLMHGDEDTLTSLEACRQFARRCEVCRFVEFTGMRHELHHESDRQDVWNTIADWMDERRG